MSRDPIDYESKLKEQVKSLERQNRGLKRARLIARLVYFLVFGTGLFFAIRYLLNYISMIDDLTRQQTK